MQRQRRHHILAAASQCGVIVFLFQKYTAYDFCSALCYQSVVCNTASSNAQQLENLRSRKGEC